MVENQPDLRLAVLIDADNAPRTALADIMAEAAVYGSPTVKRIYGDWTAPNMESWKPLLLQYAITPIQQYSYTTGKNATDSAMIIDAMDTLYSGRCDGFVLVSSDSDFTRLAIRLREAGMKVYGMGERKTPQPFIVACDKFVYIEVLRMASSAKREEAKEKETPSTSPAPRSSSKKAAEPPAEKENGRKRTPVPVPATTPAPEPPAPEEEQKRIPQEVEDMIAESLEMIADEDGYAFLGELGNLINKKRPDFDARNFGFSKLTPLIKSMERFEVDIRQTSNPHTKHIYLRDRKKK